MAVGRNHDRVTIAIGFLLVLGMFTFLLLSLKGVNEDRLALRNDVSALRNQLSSKGIEPVVGSPSPGLEGPQGLQGLQGPKGDPGFNGFPGLNGLNGDPGPAGSNGRNGENGINGIDGSPGLAGPQGPPGINGTNGTNGADGAPGANGAPGPEAVAGQPCDNGAGTWQEREQLNLETWLVCVKN